MPIFTISYDLVNKSEDKEYKELMLEMRKQRCFRMQNTVWLGAFNNSATQIHNHFRKFLEKTDRLFVAELPQHFAYTGVPKGANKWLELNPPRKLSIVEEDTANESGEPAAATAEEKPAAKKPAAKKPAAKKVPAKKETAKAK